MSMNDPIADMLTRVRNATRARKRRVDVPLSKMNLDLAKLLQREKYVGEIQVSGEKADGRIRIQLKYTPDEVSVLSGLQRVSTPGRRAYVGAGELPRVQGGLGTAVLSTSQGIRTEKECRRAGIGGEVIAYIW
jgi:small subunit ribosomal protein S8